jgi:hypothetical protein
VAVVRVNRHEIITMSTHHKRSMSDCRTVANNGPNWAFVGPAVNIRTSAGADVRLDGRPHRDDYKVISRCCTSR